MSRAFWTTALTLLAVTAFAEGPHFEAGTTLLLGDASEFVLRDGTYNNPVSRLVWPIPPSAAVTFSVEWPWTTWTSTKVTMEGAIPLTSGTIVDEDWNTGTTATDYTYARSQHTAYLTSHWSLAGEQDFALPLGFQLGIGVLYKWSSWEAWNGSGHYEEVGGTISDLSFSGLVLSYRQQWTIPFLSASWSIKESGGTLTPSVRFSPMTYCEDIDNHNYNYAYSHVQSTAFVDSFQGGMYAKVSLELALPERAGWTWGVRMADEGAWGAVGSTTATTTQIPATSYSTTNNSAGAQFQEVSVTVFMRN
jgi:outer membrane protease